MLIQVLPMISLIAPFFAVFVVSHRDYRNICREIAKEKEVKNMSIPDKSTDLSVDSYDNQYAREVLEAREDEAEVGDLTPAEQAEVDALVRGL